MLPLGDEVALHSLVFVLVLLGTRSPLWSAVLTTSLYCFLAMFRFPQVARSRARLVLQPVGCGAESARVSVIAHRGGAHDAPENTIAAIREVRRMSLQVFTVSCVTWRRTSVSHYCESSGENGVSGVFNLISWLFYGDEGQ